MTYNVGKYSLLFQQTYSLLLLGTAAAARLLQLCLTLCDPITITQQSSLSVGFPGQKYWGGLLFPSPSRTMNILAFIPKEKKEGKKKHTSDQCLIFTSYVKLTEIL